MFCHKCGKEISNNSVFCKYCGATLKEAGKRQSSGLMIGITAGLVILAGLGSSMGYQYWCDYKALNPVIDSPDDITQDLIQKIIDNSIDSLTINYEFTKAWTPTEKEGDFKSYLKWEEEQNKTNPFRRANKVSPIKRINFEIKLGSKVHSLAYAFGGFKSLEYVNIKDTSNITDMNGMFSGASSFNQPIGNWDTSNVTDMDSMFAMAKSFNQPIGNWDTSNVTHMSRMFYSAESFNQPIGNWKTSNAAYMDMMFMNAVSFNQPIDNWDTSKVRSMREMFFGATSYRHPKPRGAE